MPFNLNGEIRRFARQALASGNKALRMTGYESFATAQVEPALFEFSRAGRRFYGGAQNGSTGRAPTATLPTTAAPFVLFNGETAAGASYAIERITIGQLSGTAAVGGVILAAITNAVIPSPTAATGYATSSASKSSRASKAVWADNQTLGAQPTWLLLKGNGNPASTTNGGDSVDVNGAIVIPPGYALALHYLSGTGTTPLFLASVIWSEIEAELE